MDEHSDRVPASDDGLKRGVFVEPCDRPDGRPSIRAVVWDDSGMKRDIEHLFDNLDDALEFARSFCPTRKADA